MTANSETGQAARPELAEVIGASLAAPVTRLRTLLAEVRLDRSWSDGRLAALEQAVEETHRIGLQSQHLARLLGGKLRQSHEKLALHRVVLDLLAQRQASATAAGVVMRQHVKPVEVIVDPGLLVGLLEALVDWALQAGDELLVKLEMKNWPEHGLLTVRAVGRDRPDADNLDWQVVARTAEMMGVLLTRDLTQAHAQATLEFPRTVRELSGLTALDTEREVGPDSVRIDSQTSQLLGLRVLLVTDDRRVERDVVAVCERMNMRLETAINPRQALGLSELSQPELVIMDETLRDDAFDAHLERLMREREHFHVVEVTAPGSGFEISSWEVTSMSRIGRDNIRDQLKTVLSLEFGR